MESRRKALMKLFTGRSRHADVESRYVNTLGQEREGRMERVALSEIDS